MLKITELGFDIKNIKCDEVSIMGIHQFHKLASVWETEIATNRNIYNFKKAYYEKYGKYINLTSLSSTDLNALIPLD